MWTYKTVVFIMALLVLMVVSKAVVGRGYDGLVSQKMFSKAFQIETKILTQRLVTQTKMALALRH